MKQSTKFLCLLLTLVMLVSSIPAFRLPALAAENLNPTGGEKQMEYSQTCNSGISGIPATSLKGTSVGDGETYYAGDFSYNTLIGKQGTELLQDLRKLMQTTHTQKTTYADCRDLAKYADCQNNTPDTIRLLYTGVTATREEFYQNGNGWTREHVWPQSHASVSGHWTEGRCGGTDLHHCRPVDQPINGIRGNHPYGPVAHIAGNEKYLTAHGGKFNYASISDNVFAGWCDGAYFEPRDSVKGDVARITLYLYVRYGTGEGGDSNSRCGKPFVEGTDPLTTDPDNGNFLNIDTLLSWCALDPVDTWELGRNEYVYGKQGNRNVFIDYPELAWKLFSREIPENMTTPSRGAADQKFTLTYMADGTKERDSQYYDRNSSVILKARPEKDAPAGYTFIGWSTSPVRTQNSKPALIEKITMDRNRTVHAVYAKKEPALSSVSELTTGQYFIIDQLPGVNDTKEYYAIGGKNKGKFSGDPVTAGVQKQPDNTLRVTDKTVFHSCRPWNVEVTGTEVTVRDGDTWIGPKNKDTDFTMTATDKKWTAGPLTNGGFQLSNSETNRMILVRNDNGNIMFGNYGTSNVNTKGYGSGSLYFIRASLDEEEITYSYTTSPSAVQLLGNELRYHTFTDRPFPYSGGEYPANAEITLPEPEHPLSDEYGHDWRFIGWSESEIKDQSMNRPTHGFYEAGALFQMPDHRTDLWAVYERTGKGSTSAATSADITSADSYYIIAEKKGRFYAMGTFSPDGIPGVKLPPLAAVKNGKVIFADAGLIPDGAGIYQITQDIAGGTATLKQGDYFVGIGSGKTDFANADTAWIFSPADTGGFTFTTGNPERGVLLRVTDTAVFKRYAVSNANSEGYQRNLYLLPVSGSTPAVLQICTTSPVSPIEHVRLSYSVPGGKAPAPELNLDGKTAVNLPKEEAVPAVHGWSFVGWSLASDNFENLLTDQFTPAVDTILYAIYQKNGTDERSASPKAVYTLSWGEDGESTGTGGITASAGDLKEIHSGMSLPEKTKVNFILTPALGCIVGKLMINGLDMTEQLQQGQGTAATFSVTMTEDTTIKITWETAYFSVHYGEKEGTAQHGNITAKNNQDLVPEGGSVAAGTQVTFILKPDAGYRIGSLTLTEGENGTPENILGELKIDTVHPQGAEPYEVFTVSCFVREHTKLEVEWVLESAYQNAEIRWLSEADSEGSGTVIMTKSDGTVIPNGADVPRGTAVDFAVIADDSFYPVSITVNGSPVKSAFFRQIINENTLVKIRWARQTKPAETDGNIGAEILCGKGGIAVYEGKGKDRAEAPMIWGNSKGKKKVVSEAETLSVVFKPAPGYRVSSFDVDGRRIDVDSENPRWDSAIGSYIYEISNEKGSTGKFSFRVGFLPRKTDGGIIAVPADQLTPGKYVITGWTGTTENQHIAENTYLLIGDNDLAGGKSIGEKPSTVNLSDLEIIFETAPEKGLYLKGLNEAFLFDIQKTELAGKIQYYSIRVCGMDGNYYLSFHGSDNALYTTQVKPDENIPEEAQWSIELDPTTGQAEIVNRKKTDYHIAFNTNAGQGLLFRCYGKTSAAMQRPTLYKAENVGFVVDFGVDPQSTGNGTITAYNKASNAEISSGNVQKAGDELVFQLKPAAFSHLQKLKIIKGDRVIIPLLSELTESDGVYTFSVTVESAPIRVEAAFEETVRDITVEYYVDAVSLEEAPARREEHLRNHGDLYNIDFSDEIQIEGLNNNEPFPVSLLNFVGAINGVVEYAPQTAHDGIMVADGDTVKLYFTTTNVELTKTIAEKTVTGGSAHGGDKTGGFAAEGNIMDENGNVRQSYEVTLSVKSSALVPPEEKQVGTDIILLLDDSGSMKVSIKDQKVNNLDITKEAIGEFLKVVLAPDKSTGKPSPHRVAVTRYNAYAGIYVPDEVNSPFGDVYELNLGWDNAYPDYFYTRNMRKYAKPTYDLCFMSDREAIENAVNKTLAENNEATNTMGGFFMAEQAARLRENVDFCKDRNLVIIVFSDGRPTVRFLRNSSGVLSPFTGADNGNSGRNGASFTSSHEYNETVYQAESLRSYIDDQDSLYPGRKSAIYAIALESADEFTAGLKPSVGSSDYIATPAQVQKSVEYLFGAAPRYWGTPQALSEAWTFEVAQDADEEGRWTAAERFSDKFYEVTGQDNNYQKDLLEAFADIAGETTKPKYLTGDITDRIPADFELEAESRTALEESGWKITDNPDGSTLIERPGVQAKKETSTFNYRIIYRGRGTGARYTNDYAKYSYHDLLTDQPVTVYFNQPVASVIPWTRNDNFTVSLNDYNTLPILENDLFEANLKAGGWTVSSRKIILTDENGTESIYNDAVENPDGFDANVTPDGSIEFRTRTASQKSFWYIVEATVVRPDGSAETVRSRVTEVTVSAPEIKVEKSAEEITNLQQFAQYSVPEDDHGNQCQLFRITLRIKNSDAETITGTVTDTLPAGFEFIEMLESSTGHSLQYDEKTHAVKVGSIEKTADTGENLLEISYLVRARNTACGSCYTNVDATFDCKANGIDYTLHFPQPVVGILPRTVNDITLADQKGTGKISVLENDFCGGRETALQEYPVTEKKIVLCDAQGTELTGMPEGFAGLIAGNNNTLEYALADGVQKAEFYYKVVVTVAEPPVSRYEISKTLTHCSRPTKVTVLAAPSDVVVLDFGLPMKNVVYGKTAADVVIADKAPAGELEKAKPQLSELKGNGYYVNCFTEEDGSQTLIPTTINFAEPVEFTYTLTLPQSVFNLTEQKTIGKVTALPASNVYYEADFIKWEGREITDATDNPVLVPLWQDEGTAVPDMSQSFGNDIRHGYDSVYEIQTDYSGGKTKAVTVSSPYEEAFKTGSFIFTGTGFDLYSVGSKDGGMLTVRVYPVDPVTQKVHRENCICNFMVDTYVPGDTVYYQIPAVMCRELKDNGSEFIVDGGLTYGTYYVDVIAYYDRIFDHNYSPEEAQQRMRSLLRLKDDEVLIYSSLREQLGKPEVRKLPEAANGQYNIYVDAVRIYNPMNPEREALTEIAYGEKENNPAFVNINNALLIPDHSWTGEGAYSGMGTVFIPGGIGSSTQEEDSNFDSDGFFFGKQGTLKTEPADNQGRYYLLGAEDADGNPQRIRYKNHDVYYRENENHVRTFCYADETAENGEVILTAAQVASLGIHYLHASKYDMLGPENEVYLQKGNGIAFSVPEGAHVQVSAKVPCGSGAILQSWDGTHWQNIEINSRTELYYDLPTAQTEIILRCGSETPDNAVLSLCNVKITGQPAAKKNLKVTERTLMEASRAFGPAPALVLYTVSWIPADGSVICEKIRNGDTVEENTEVKFTLNPPAGKELDTMILTVGGKETRPECLGDGSYTVMAAGDIELTVTWKEKAPEHRQLPFTDLEKDAWYIEYVQYVWDHSLMNGHDAATFEPEGKLTRAQLAQILYNREGMPETKADTSFPDVKTENWYWKAVLWAAEKGYVNGFEDGTFRGDEKITREQLATILWRCAGKPETEGTIPFKDADKAQSYAVPALTWAVKSGILQGKEDNCLDPAGNATRAEAAAMLMRFCELPNR